MLLWVWLVVQFREVAKKLERCCVSCGKASHSAAMAQQAAADAKGMSKTVKEIFDGRKA
jgi:hypothetical protein